MQRRLFHHHHHHHHHHHQYDEGEVIRRNGDEAVPAELFRLFCPPHGWTGSRQDKQAEITANKP